MTDSTSVQGSRPDHERRYVARGRDGGSVKTLPPLQVLHVVEQNPHTHCPRSKEAGDGDQCIKPRMRDRHRLLVARQRGVRRLRVPPTFGSYGNGMAPEHPQQRRACHGPIRNGIEILAAFAGMPQVSAVHIHSNPASYIYNLRPEYNVVMTQALGRNWYSAAEWRRYWISQRDAVQDPVETLQLTTLANKAQLKLPARVCLFLLRATVCALVLTHTARGVFLRSV